MSELNWIQKQLRARVIRDHLSRLGQRQAVCLTCGNAAKALEACGVHVVEVGEGPRALLVPKRWLTASEVAWCFPGVFDATPGHLSAALMVQVAQLLREKVVESTVPRLLPTGSGETFVCLKMAFPHRPMVPVYGTTGPTQYNGEAPLNRLVAALAWPQEARFEQVGATLGVAVADVGKGCSLQD